MRRHKACAKPSLASPFGGGALQRRAERARCQRPLRMGCVEALASYPLSRLAATAPPKGEPSLASPLGGRWCPVGTVQRLTELAGESGLALARTERASCRPHHPLPWLSPLRARAPRSLVPFWLRAHKVKGKVEAFLKRKRVRPADVPQKTLISLRSAPGAHVRFSLAQA